MTRTATPTASETLTATPSTTPTVTAAITPASCDDLEGRIVGEASILSTTAVSSVGADPAYCLVSGRIGAALHFELRLPVGWNGKAVFMGGGGYDGTIPVPSGSVPAPSPLQRLYVTIGTDSGHRGSPFDGTWALDDDEAVDNFADLAWHRVLGAAREIVRLHYAAPPRRIYFEGGSSGGREGLIQAQRWPDDYDGVVAREPLISFTGVMLADNRIAQSNYVGGLGWVSGPSIQALSLAILAACDGLDGLEDQIVSNVAACHFDPATLFCTAPAELCLTAEQLVTVESIFSDLELPFALANGVTVHPGYPMSGAEDETGGWALWQTGFTPANPSSLSFTLQDQFVRYFVTQDANYDSLTFSPAAAEAELTALSARLDATDADLSRFRARGGKLILWHGWADYAISAWGTVQYYDRVVAAAGGQRAADEFVRFYTAPGVDHTGGGRGAPIADLLGALDAWVEQGSAPGDLIAYRAGGAAFQAFRPLCRYPSYPRYDAGDPASAASFHCAAPAPE